MAPCRVRRFSRLAIVVREVADDLKAISPYHHFAVIVVSALPIMWLLSLEEQVCGIIFEPMATN